MSTDTFSKKELLAYLIVDRIQVQEEVLNKAENDDGVSLAKIGNIYYHKEEYKKAVGWYLLSSAQGNAHSQFKLGYMYSEGEGVSVNYKESMNWYMKASENNDAPATNNIGYLYDNGLGVKKNYKLAFKWYLKAANKGYDCAQNNVGLCYEYGLGVKVDMQYALEWYEKGSQQGYDDAKENVKHLNEKCFYLTDRQKRYIHLEKCVKKQKSIMKLLKKRIRLMKQKVLKKDNEIKLLKQENGILKLNSYVDTKEQMNLSKDSFHQLETFSKMVTDWASSDTGKAK